MEKRTFFSAKNIAYLAVLLALTVVLQIFASAIPVGATGATLNFSLIPIVLGAVLLGAWAGAFLGFSCGVVVLIQVITMSGNPFYAAIWTYSPVVTVFTCIVKTTAAGAVAGLLYRLISKKSTLAGVITASAVVPIINTGLFILGCLCMNGTIAEFGVSAGASVDGINLLVFILVGLVSFNFFIEFAINLVLAPALHRVVIVTEKQIGKKYKKSQAEQA